MLSIINYSRFILLSLKKEIAPYHKPKLFKVICICLLFAFSLPANAQFRTSLYDEMEKEYPNENLVQINNLVHYDISVKKDEIKIEQRTEARFMMLKNPTGSPFEQSVFTSTFKELTDYEANSYVPDEKKYKKIPVKSYNEKSNMGNLAFYDDVKVKTFTFPATAGGTIAELVTEHEIKEPRILNATYLKWYYPIRNYELKIEFDNEVDLDLIKINFKGEPDNLQIESNNRRTTYTWKKENLEKVIQEDGAPDIRYFVPHIIPVIRGYKTRGKDITILEDVPSLYKWYYSFVEDIDKNIDQAPLQAIVDSIKKESGDEFEIVENLYYWVQSNIKYIAFEYGLGGFIPRKPDVVLANNYGDCKDKSSILYMLLKLAGIQSHLTWIGTNDIPYGYDEVPTPAVDNHMILTYVKDDKYYFLDGTGKFQNIAYPTAFIQGKEALIGIDKDNYEIKKVPVVKAEESYIRDTLYLEISGTDIIGKGKSYIKGYPKIDIQNRLLVLEEGNKRDKLLEGYLQKGNNKYVLRDYKLDGLKSYEGMITIDYNFDISNYVQKLGKEIFINLNLEKSFVGSKIKKERKYPKQFKWAMSKDDVCMLKIPEGYSVKYLPPDQEKEIGNYGFRIAYQKKDDNTIMYKQELWNDQLLLTPAEFKDWTEFIRDLEKAYRETILLVEDKHQ